MHRREAISAAAVCAALLGTIVAALLSCGSDGADAPRSRVAAVGAGIVIDSTSGAGAADGATGAGGAFPGPGPGVGGSVGIGGLGGIGELPGGFGGVGQLPTGGLGGLGQLPGVGGFLNPPNRF